jgi:hypothetical protein
MVVPLRFAPNTYRYDAQSVDDLFKDELTTDGSQQTSIQAATERFERILIFDGDFI